MFIFELKSYVKLTVFFIINPIFQQKMLLFAESRIIRSLLLKISVLETSLILLNEITVIFKVIVILIILF
jgi:hypothetical protein